MLYILDLVHNPIIMKILNLANTPLDSVVEQALNCLKKGGILIYPTETLYGIGVDATNELAVQKLLTYKARREGKPLSIAVADQSMAENYADLNQSAKKLYNNFLPGPMTVISKAKVKSGLATGVCSERGTIGIRIPDYELIRSIVTQYGKPITASSANASYKKRPYNVYDIFNNISQKQAKLIDLVLDAGQLPKREPSTVVDTTASETTVLRQGNIKLTPSQIIKSASEEETILIASKLLNQYKHYLNERAIIFALVGEMGAGKTHFTKGLAKGLGINDLIKSPTFNIANEFKFHYSDNARDFIHIDTWRLLSDQEFIDLSFKPKIDNCAVLAIEWADKISNILDQWSSEAKIIWVRFEYGKDKNNRIITISDHQHK